jgi:MFS superfamily sulfate permease-like transporter
MLNFISSFLQKLKTNDGHISSEGFVKNLKYDLSASIVVFFVALPLCLGIALASGAPLFAGVIAGVVGGIIIGTLSGSALGVSGPAAGLATIVFSYVTTLGSWESFLPVIIIAGFIQIAMGFLRLGTIAYYFPSSVIKGMLVGIGLLIIIKQIPYALGYSSDSGNVKLINFYDSLAPGVILVSALSITLLICWEKFLSKKYQIFQAIPAPLAVVILGIALSGLYAGGLTPFSLHESHLVNIPVAKNFQEFFGNFQFPDFNQIKNPDIYIMALTLAIIASLETLLSTEACDKIDPQKRITPANRELKAQGVGNIICGLVGGLPVTQVIVRSSANVTFGAKTKLSAILHGFILLIAAISIPKLLNMIPLASLACVLLVIGYKLAKPEIFKQIYHQGQEQFLPFIATVIGILAFDLLKGIALGMIIASAYILINNFRNPYQQLRHKTSEEHQYIFKLSEEVSFLNRGKILEMLSKIPGGADVVIDGSHSKFIHYDVIEILKDFKISSKSKNITLKFKGIDFRKFK